MIRRYLQALPLLSRDARLIVAASALAGFSYAGVFFLLTNLYLLRLDCGAEFIGIYAGTGALSFAAFCIPAGLVGRRFGYRAAMIGGFSVAALGLGLVALAVGLPAPWRPVWLLACCALRELGNSFFTVNASPFLVDVTRPEDRSYAFSVRSVMYTVAGFAGSLVGGLLPRLSAHFLGSSTADPRVYMIPLLLGALLFVPGIVALTRTTRPDSPLKELPPQSRERALRFLVRLRALRVRSVPLGKLGPGGLGGPPGPPVRVPAEAASPPRPGPTLRPLAEVAAPNPPPYAAMGMMALVAVLSNAALAAAMCFYNVYMDSVLRAPTALIGSVAAVCQLLAAGAGLALPAIIHRAGVGRTFLVGAVGMTCSALPLAFVPHWLGAGLGVIGVGALNTIAATAITLYHQELVSSDWRSVISAVHLMASALCWTAMGMGGGYFIVWQGYPAYFAWGAALTGLGSVAFWLYARLHRGEYARRME